MSFEEYLVSKKIDSKAFSDAQLTLWQEWQLEFEKLHPASFTSQKLYLINKIRRQHPLKDLTLNASSEKKEVVRSKPIIRPKIT